MSADEVPQDAKVWENAIRKLRGGFMPPPNAKKHRDAASVHGLVSWLETTLDSAQVEPAPGRVPLRRLNRREYANADVNRMAIAHHLQRTRGGSALHYAVRMDYKKVVQELISYGADVNAEDPDGLTALDYAQSRGYIPFLGQKTPVRPELVEMLREHGATVELAQTPNWPPVGPPIGYEATIWPL